MNILSKLWNNIALLAASFGMLADSVNAINQLIRAHSGLDSLPVDVTNRLSDPDTTLETAEANGTGKKKGR